MRKGVEKNGAAWYNNYVKKLWRMISMLDSHEKQYHINVTSEQIGKYCIIPGDPGRCEKIAAYLDNPYHVSQNREYNIWNGTLCGEPVTVCSTGIGGPSAAIAMEELVACGAHTFIRVGTCGGMGMDVVAGDIVIASGAVRQDGTSREYAPIEFPAVSNTDVLLALRDSARKLNVRNHVGIVQAKDSFYGQHDPKRIATSSYLVEKWEAWKKLGVLASEMESGTLFVVASLLGVRCGALFCSVWNQVRYEAGLDDGEVHDTSIAIKVAIEAMKNIISDDRKKI